MINLNSLNVFGLIIFCYNPFILRGYGQHINTFWLGLSANGISLIIIFFTYLILKFDLKTDKNTDMNITTLMVSIFSLFLVPYLAFGLFSDNVVFVGGKYFSYAIYSYFIYTYLFLQFLIIFSLRFYNQLKKERL